MNRKEELSQNLELVRSKIAKVADHEVTLIAVTKTFPVSDAQILHELGVLDFGENRDAEVAPHPLQIFLQVSLDGAHHRGGAGLEELYSLASLVEKSPTHTLAGLMSVPPVEMDPNEAFAQLAVIHKEFMQLFPGAQYLSAGMSGDYEAAISHGATHVRVGSSILGSRSPHL